MFLSSGESPGGFFTEPKAMETGQKIYIAGHRGMVGAALARALRRDGFDNLALAGRDQLDLLNQAATRAFLEKERPDVVILAAARVGGIEANRAAPAEFLYENLAIQNNVIDAAYRVGVKQLIFLGSSCVYPRECSQPMKEEALMTGPLEPTNEGYALAKIAGMKLAQFYKRQYGLSSFTPMPCNLYGPGDHFDLFRSHVLSALVRRFVDATDEGRDEVTLWGTGAARREFMHVDDLADAVLFLARRDDTPDIINVGVGNDFTIAELANMIASAVGYAGEIKWDVSRPDGMPRKCLDVTKLNEMGFKPRISLAEGVQRTVAEYRALKAKGLL